MRKRKSNGVSEIKRRRSVVARFRGTVHRVARETTNANSPPIGGVEIAIAFRDRVGVHRIATVRIFREKLLGSGVAVDAVCPARFSARQRDRVRARGGVLICRASH